MKKTFIIFLFLSFAVTVLALPPGLMVPTREENNFFPLTHNLDDSTGDMLGASNTRVSAKTYIDPRDGLLKTSSGYMNQLVEAASINPVTGNSFWSMGNITLGSSGEFIAADADNEAHYIARGMTVVVGNYYVASAKIKAGKLGWCRFSLIDGATTGYIYYDLATGAAGTTVNLVSYGLEAADADGYRRMWAILNAVNGTTMSFVVYAAEADLDINYSDTSGNPLITVKNLNLTQLPSGFALGSELVQSGTDMADTYWANQLSPETNEQTTHDGQTNCRHIVDSTPSYGGFRTAASYVWATTTNNYYYVTFKYKVISGFLDVRVRYGNDSGFNACLTGATASSWTTYQGIIKESVGGSGAYIYFINPSNSVGAEFYIDDVSVKRLPSALVSSYSSGWKISVPPYTATTTVPAQNTFEANGLGFSPGGMNLLPYSEDFSTWTASNTTVTIGQTSPTGGAEAYALTATSANGTLKYTVTGAGTSTAEYFSIWMKRISGTGNIDVTLDNGSTWTTKTLTTSWQRFSKAQTLASPVVGIRVVTSGDSIAIYGANLTPTPYLLPYIPSRGAPTYTVPDTITITNSAGLKNIISDAQGDATSEGTIVYTIAPGGTETDIAYPSAKAFVDMGSGTWASYIYATPDPYYMVTCYDGTTSSGVQVTWDDGDSVIFAAYWSKSRNAKRAGYSKNGGSWAWSTETTYDGSMPFSTNLRIGAAMTVPFYIKNLTIFPRALTQAEIESNF